MDEGCKNSKKNFKFVSLISVAAIIALAAGTMSFRLLAAGSDDRDSIILSLIGQSIEAYHYSLPAFDDGFSAKVMDSYIEKLDYSKRFLLKSDIDALNRYRYNIDNYIIKTNLTVPRLGTSIIKQRQKEAEQYYRQAIDGVIDFSIDESVETEPDSLQYAATADELRESWRKWIKLVVLEKLYDKIKLQEKALKNNDTAYHEKTIQELQAEAVSSVRQNYDSWMKSLESIKDDSWTALFFNAIMESCDPHTEYFPPEEKKSFDVSLSGKFEGIGATLLSRNGLTIVSDILPGSASWRQGELEAGDIITMVGQGDNQPVDVYGMQLDDVVKLIRGPKGTTVKLTVKKIDNTVKIIPLVRDVVVLEETYAKSSVLTMPGSGKRIGLIYLPKFYADFNDRLGRFCSLDVKKEIAKLKEDGVDGIIFDLRNNGGGSLSDVVDMTGLFTGKGPVVQVCDREGKVSAQDSNISDAEYSGPMVVLINNNSASASEIFAAALQDYDRAIIMGSQSSFGKGSVQTMLDLDRFIAGWYSVKPLGSIKMTIQKFYRVSGGSTQLRGVESDIVVPDYYTYMPIGEKDLQNAMSFDQIPKARHNLFHHKYSKRKVVEASRLRIKESEIFSKIDANAKRMKKNYELTLLPLSLEKFRVLQKQKEEEAEPFKDLGKSKTGLDARLTAADKRESERDPNNETKFKKWMDDIEKDVYIFEASNVILDMLK